MNLNNHIKIAIYVLGSILILLLIIYFIVLVIYHHKYKKLKQWQQKIEIIKKNLYYFNSIDFFSLYPKLKDQLSFEYWIQFISDLNIKFNQIETLLKTTKFHQYIFLIDKLKKANIVLNNLWLIDDILKQLQSLNHYQTQNKNYCLILKRNLINKKCGNFNIYDHFDLYVRKVYINYLIDFVNNHIINLADKEKYLKLLNQFSKQIKEFDDNTFYELNLVVNDINEKVKT